MKADKKAEAPPVVLLEQLPPNPYNHDRKSCPDVVTHNGISYQILGMLGEGTFGRVFFAFASTGKNVALKTVHKRKCYRWPDEKEGLLSERNCMAIAARERLPFWTSLNAAWEDENNVYMEMDVCTGTLRNRITRANKTGAPMSPNEIRLLCAEMLCSLWDLCRHQIVHGDIKPDNFLVRPDGRVVLADFGFATTPSSPFKDREAFRKWGTVRGGTPGYMARAVLDKDGYCSHETDIFSLGVVFVELMAGMQDPLWDVGVVPERYPEGEEHWFSLSAEKQQRWLMANVGIWEVGKRICRRGFDLCRWMLMEEPPRVEQLMGHSYFEGVNFDSVYDGLIPHDYQPHFRQMCTSAKKCDLTFAAWHRGQEPPAEYENDPVFGQVVNHRGEVVHRRWIMDNNAVVQQMEEPLPNFEWPEPPTAMLFRTPAPGRESPPPAPPGFARTPGHRPQGTRVPPPGLPAPVAPQAPLHPPGLAHPPNQPLADGPNASNYFPPPGLPPPMRRSAT
ncbi:kinase-like domain-containing protein [Cerioporus squamosus]|nr:kinase-like domain-containing protein [Cerioporus squamosus]